MEVLIIANGECPRHEILFGLAENAGTIIAADGGCLHCLEHQIKPDFIVGDLDSATPDLEVNFPESKIIHIQEQETTDLEKALNLALTLNPSKITLIAVSGRRIDHSIANLLIFQQYSEQVKLEIRDNDGVLRILPPGQHTLSLPPGSLISCFSLQPIRELTLTGFRYPLTGGSYDPTFSGISNITLETEARISFSEGRLFLYTLLY